MTSSNPVRSDASRGSWKCPTSAENWQRHIIELPDGVLLDIDSAKTEGDTVNFVALVSFEGERGLVARYWCEDNTVWLVRIAADGTESPRKEFASVYSPHEVFSVCIGLLNVLRREYD